MLESKRLSAQTATPGMEGRENLERIRSLDSKWEPRHIEAFFEKLTGLFKAYDLPARDFEIKAFWLQAVDHFPFEEVVCALKKITGQKIYGKPTPDLLVLELQGGDQKDIAKRAWAEIFWAIQKFGPWQTVNFSSESVAAMVRRIGWSKLCSMATYDLEQLGKDSYVYYSIGPDGKGREVLGLVDASRQASGHLPLPRKNLKQQITNKM